METFLHDHFKLSYLSESKLMLMSLNQEGRSWVEIHRELGACSGFGNKAM